jgi:hypothetical protein
MLSEREFLLRLAQADPADLTPDELARKNLFNRSTLSKPLVMVNSSTAGMVAGAGGTMETIKEYVSERNIEIDLAETGSIGLSSEEPVVSVQLPGRSPPFFPQGDRR